MRFSDFIGENAVAKRELDYDRYIRLMEEMRLNYGRAQRRDPRL
jgi:hypothetical protein